MNKQELLLYAITDCDHLQGQALLERTEKILANGATMLQYRDKEGKARQDVSALQALCKQYQVPFIVNDDVELALAIDADGVHVGQEDMACQKARERLGADKIVGVTAKTLAQAEQALADGADYLGVGAMFPSASKDSSLTDRDTLKSICEKVDLPVVAIGGISEDNMASLAGTGIAGIAVIGALYSLPNPTFTVQRMARRMAIMVHGDAAIDGILADVDGTLTDTLGFYQALVPDMLRAEGLRVGPDLVQIIAPLSMPESVGYVKHNYSGLFGVGQVVDALEHRLEMYYHTQAEAKDGVKDFLAKAKERGIKVMATSIHDAEVCQTLFEHTGLERLLDGTVSGWEKRYGGGDSKLFAMGAEQLGGGRIWAFNDAIEGVFAARGAGLAVAAVYDEHHSESEWKQIVKNADLAFMSWDEALSWLSTLQ